MRDLSSAESTRLGNLLQECDCCPRPCCDYCEIDISWSVVGSATRDVGSDRETVTFNWLLNFHFERDDNPLAPSFPPTFRAIELIGESECQLIPNSPPFTSLISGSYHYEKKDISSGTILDEEDVDIVPRITTFDLNVNCDCESIPGPVSTVNLDLAGGDFPATMPACFLGYGAPLVLRTITNFGEEAPCRGTVRILDSAPCAPDWDSSSLAENLVVNLTPCTPLPLVAANYRPATMIFRKKDCPTCPPQIFTGSTQIA